MPTNGCATWLCKMKSLSNQKYFADSYIALRLLDNTVGVVVQRGCANWRARVIKNWLLIHGSPPDSKNELSEVFGHLLPVTYFI